MDVFFVAKEGVGTVRGPDVTTDVARVLVQVLLWRLSIELPLVLLLVLRAEECATGLLGLGYDVWVWLAQESIVSQFLSVGINLGIDTWKGNICEVCEVLTNGYVQGVGAVENVGVRLEISPPTLTHLIQVLLANGIVSHSIQEILGASRVQEVLIVKGPVLQERCGPSDRSWKPLVLLEPLLPRHRNRKELGVTSEKSVTSGILIN